MLTRRSFLKITSFALLALSFKVSSKQIKSIYMPQDYKKNIESDLIKWDSILLHRTGTDGDEQTANWLAEEILKTKAKPELDSFQFTQRVPGRSAVTDGINKAMGLPMFDGGSTGQEGIKGKAGTLSDSMPLAITNYGSNDRDESTNLLNKARRQNKHLGIIAIANVAPNVPGLAVLNAESYREPYGPPVLQVATKEEDWLLKAQQEGRYLTMFSELKEKRTSALNIQTKILGKNRSLKPLVVMTPRSGWWTCTSERGGGICIWLNAIRYFSTYQPERTVIFTANTGHELSHIGLDHYLEKNPELISGAHAWVHLGANFAAKDGPVLWQASSKEFMKRGLEALSKENMEEVISMPVGNRPLGEARNIYDGGGQYISLLGGNPLFHHPDDRWPDAIDMPKLLKLNNMMINMIVGLANEH